MKSKSLVAAVLAGVLVSGCKASNLYPASGLRLGEAESIRMVESCFWQASKITHLRQGAIFISERVETPNGPVLLMEAAGTPLSCHRNSAGEITVSREVGVRASPSSALEDDPS